MDDLFPDSLHHDAVGFDAIRYVAPLFFAIYPSAGDLPRVAAWQRRLCRQWPAREIAMLSPELLHVSAACFGTPRRQRQPLNQALRSAAERFVHPCFELTLNATTRFGTDHRAFVALANETGMRAVHGLRLAMADAQKPFGLSGSRGISEAHLTLGYGDGLADEPRPVEPIRFLVEAVDLVASHVGHSQHVHLDRWPLTS